MKLCFEFESFMGFILGSSVCLLNHMSLVICYCDVVVGLFLVFVVQLLWFRFWFLF